MVLQEKPDSLHYWVLYEGTPGGSIDAGDHYVLSDGVQHNIYDVIDGDLAGEEWLYFGDGADSNVLYLANHQEDEALDCHYVMEDNMTVFGFGRDKSSSAAMFLDAVPGHYTFGLTGASGHAQIAAQIRAAYKPLLVTVGTAEGW